LGRIPPAAFRKKIEAKTLVMNWPLDVEAYAGAQVIAGANNGFRAGAGKRS
jgi:hypothetical protein